MGVRIARNNGPATLLATYWGACMRFVRLLLDDRDATEVYVNLDHVIDLQQHDGYTHIRTIGRHDDDRAITYTVREKPQEILRLGREEAN